MIGQFADEEETKNRSKSGEDNCLKHSKLRPRAPHRLWLKKNEEDRVAKQAIVNEDASGDVLNIKMQIQQLLT